MLQIDMDCEKCGEVYTYVEDRWCKPCQIDNLKKNFINWTSGNEVVDNYIQEKQQKEGFYDIDNPNSIILEWIPYNQLNDIKEINSDLYSAIWKDGPLYFCFHKREYLRKSGNQKVILETLYNSQNITNETLNEV